MQQDLVHHNLTAVTDSLGQFLAADKKDSVVLEQQLMQLARLEGIVNVARPFIKTYKHYVDTNPQLPACILQLLQCYPNQAMVELSCQAVVMQYVNLMAGLQSFVSRSGLWTPELQNAFVELYDAVNKHQFATLLTLMDMCRSTRLVSVSAGGCTDVTAVLEKLLDGNTLVLELSTNLLTLLNTAAVDTVVNTFFNKCYEWNTKVFFYLGAHIVAPFVGLATGVDWRNPEKAKWYTIFYASVKGIVDELANTELAQLFVFLFKPPELRAKFTFNFFKPFVYGQTAKGYALYYLDYLYKWNESLTRYVQSHYVQPLLERALTDLLATARSMYFHEYVETALGSLVDFVAKLYIPDVASSISYLIVTIVLPMLLPYITYYANVGVNKLINLLEKQVMKYTRHMKYVASNLPPSPSASVRSEDQQMLRFLDQLIEKNKGSWSYRAFKWFVSLLLKDSKKAKRRRIIAYKCIRPQGQCMPVLEGDVVKKNDMYYLTAQQCKLKC